ncbi:uncharacterized protein LOC114576241 [Exaiptasia diaphana]|uniref:Bcl-2 Bcl-2 homology region 1-3 domain-containing protein n=1 Tax=Exaiptasia diaphana TaxID=2652724 RepID=A0A913YUW5_EXADI|nr:uncharacterized protein LOC114576241 [Exaiptasia diaphana]
MATAASSDCLRSSSLSEAEVNILYRSLQLSVDYIWHRISLEVDQSQLASLQQYFPVSTQPSSLGQISLSLLNFGASHIEGILLSKDIVQRLHLTPSTVHSTFKHCAEVIFDGEINWFNIIGLFAFSGIFANHFVKNYKSEMALLKTLPYLVPDFFGDHRSILTWIIENGGWDGFLYASSNKFGVTTMLLKLAQFPWIYRGSARYI